MQGTRFHTALVMKPWKNLPYVSLFQSHNLTFWDRNWEVGWGSWDSFQWPNLEFKIEINNSYSLAFCCCWKSNDLWVNDWLAWYCRYCRIADNLDEWCFRNLSHFMKVLPLLSFFQVPCRKVVGHDTRVYISVLLRKITIDLLYIWEV